MALSDTKKFYLVLLAITLIGIAFRFYRITEQPPLSDEVDVAFTANNYMERGHFVPTMPHHPNLRNILTYMAMKYSGTGVFGLRGFSLLFGVLTIPALGLLMLRITSSRIASVLTSFFLAVDPVHITFSRQAIQEEHTVFFFLIGTLLTFMGMKDSEKDIKIWPLVLSGISFGLGLASKGHALLPLLVCLGILLHKGLKSREPVITVFAFASLVLLPVTIYLLTDLPWFERGYSLSDWIFMKGAISERMTTKYIPVKTETNIDIRAWQWFIVPMIGYSSFSFAEGKPFVTMATGNPLIMLLVLPSALYLMKKNRGWLVQIFFWASYLPLVFAPRPIFFLSSTAVTPFAYGILGIAASDFLQGKWKKILYAYLLSVIIVSLLLYPLSIGKALDYGYTKSIVERVNPHPLR